MHRSWGWLASRPTRVTWTAVVVAYLAGSLLWLALGLLPPLADAVAPVRHGLRALAGGHGRLAGPAGRIVEHRTSLQHGAWVAAEYLFSALNVGLGVLLTVRCRHDRVPRLLALAFLGTAATFNAPSHAVFHILGAAPLVTGIHFMFHIVSGVAYLWAALLFPDGRLPLATRAGRRPAAVIAVTATVVVAFVCWRSSFISHPPFFVVFFGVLVPLVGITAQTWRLRQPGLAPAARQQSRLFRLALLPALAAAALWLAAQAATSSTAADRLSAAVENTFPAVFAAVPVVLFVAILRYRLWDIDVLLSRTLLLALLAGIVALVYGAVLLATGSALRDHGWPAVAAMAVVALVVEPARQRCRRLANRLVFGQELTPREAMQQLAARLADPAAADGLSELSRLVVSGTRCTGAQVWLVLPDHLLLAAATPAGQPGRTVPLAGGSPQDALPDRRCLPVTHQGRLRALLAVTAPAGVSLPAAEQRLLADLAGHAGLLVANAQLTADLRRQLAVVTERAEELARSRAQVVRAQDEERRRLERDIHDGAQQQLVALMVQLGTARRSWAQGVGPAAQHVGQLRALLADTAESVRELAAGWAPAVLREQGLRPALLAAAAAAERAGQRVIVDCPVARLPLQVETAAYFCCLEAMQNALKHARAEQVTVTVAVADGQLRCAVTDDGTGFDVDATPGGSGLRSLAARLAPYAGTVSVRSARGSGTTVELTVPLLPEPVRELAAAGSS